MHLGTRPFLGLWPVPSPSQARHEAFEDAKVHARHELPLPVEVMDVMDVRESVEAMRLDQGERKEDNAACC